MHLLNILLIMQKLEKDIGNDAHVSLHVIDENLGVQVDLGKRLRYRRLFHISDLEEVSEEVLLLYLVKELKEKIEHGDNTNVKI